MANVFRWWSSLIRCSGRQCEPTIMLGSHCQSHQPAQSRSCSRVPARRSWMVWSGMHLSTSVYCDFGVLSCRLNGLKADRHRSRSALVNSNTRSGWSARDLVTFCHADLHLVFTRSTRPYSTHTWTPYESYSMNFSMSSRADSTSARTPKI